MFYGEGSGINSVDYWSFESRQANTDLGTSVSTAGDVNGDGFDDIIAGAPKYESESGHWDEGAVYLWYGSTIGMGFWDRPPDWKREINHADDRFGHSVSTAGDVNGDGFSDILIGAPGTDEGGTYDVGQVYAYYGAPGGPLAFAGAGNPEPQYGGDEGLQFGFAVGTAGDVDGDGDSEIIVGAPYFDAPGDNRGKVFVWYGSADSWGIMNTTPDWTFIGEHDNDWFGYAVGTAGDVDGNGYDDIIVGAASYDNGQANEGAVYVWHGGVDGLGASDRTADWKYESNRANTNLGNSVGTAGDVDGNGCDDIIAGAEYYDNEQADEGAIYVWQGSDTGLCQDEFGNACDPDSFVESNQPNARFGFSVGTAGDVDGNGYSDIIVSTPYFDAPEWERGKVFVWYGADGGLGKSPGNADWEMIGESGGDYFGQSVSTAGDVNGDGYSDILIGAVGMRDPWEGAVYVVYGGEGGMQSGYWKYESNQVNTQLGYSVSAAGDVNGDGYADILAGAPYYEAGHTNEGAVLIWYGAAEGMGDTQRNPDWMYESDQAHAWFGQAVGTAGDVNGDGFSDLLIGAPGYDYIYDNAGYGFVFHGSAQGLSAAADPAIEGDQGGAQLGFALDSAGDVDGNGYADIIVAAPYFDSGDPGEGRVYVFEGSPTGLITSTAWHADGDQLEAFFGWSVGSAGDVNGDGYSDIIIGAPYYDHGQVNEGAAFVWLGSKKGLGPSGSAGDPLTWSVEGDQLSAFFGWAVSTAGDVDGDGFSEVIIGAPGYNKGQDDEGRAYLYYGSGSGLSTSPGWSDEGDQVEAGFGNAVGTAGDVDGDGYGDVIIGADQYDNGQVNEGRAYVYYGSEGGLTPDPAWKAEGDQANARFGCAASSAGDVNGDGYADVLIGAYRYDYHPLKQDEGAAFVWHGSAGGLGADGTPGDAAWMAAGDQVNAQFGYAVDTAGDVNGDGFADIIIGAPYYDSGPLNDGRAFAYHGSQEGLSPTARWSGEGGDIGGAQFGYAVSAAGDVNGDGFADVIVGAPSFDHIDEVDPTVPDVGLVSLYTGNGLNGLPLRPRQLQPDGSPLAHLGKSTSETEVRLSLLARSPLGRESVRMEWQVAPLGTPFSDPSVISGSTSNWTDTGINGTLILQTIAGLSPGTAYHWRLRLIYSGNAQGLGASRWIHMPWDGWQEVDIRTSGEPQETPLVYLPIIFR